jgi:hypothetical protein
MRYATLLPLLALGLGVVVTGAPQTVAQTSAPAVSCKDMNIPLGTLPADTIISFTVTSANLVQQCQSSTGLALTLITPKAGITVNPKPNFSQTIPFTVSDSKGNTATANVIVTRQ